jgi:glucokinase
MRSALGVDIGGTNLRVARVTGDGRIADRRSEAISRDPDAVLTHLIRLCRTLDDPAVVGIGIGVPGRVDPRRREVLSGGYIDLAGQDLARRVEDALGKPVLVDNDCSMALMAEMALGAAQGCRHAIMFTIGTGIGGAVALEGRIAHGAGTAGQLGHITVAPDGLLCKCGRRGCVETTSSGTALARHIAEAGFTDDTRVEDLLAAADKGQATAIRVLERWARPLRVAIDSMVAAVAPEVVLLGGGLGRAARAALEHAPARSPWYQCRVEAADLDDHAGVIGCALAALAATHEAQP